MAKFKFRHLVFVPFWAYTEVESDDMFEAIELWQENDYPSEIDYDNYPKGIDLHYDFERAEIDFGGNDWYLVDGLELKGGEY